MRILITGITGLVGTALRGRLLARGDTLVGYTRRPQPAAAQIHWFTGDSANPQTYAGVLGDIDAVINLAGSPIARPWTQAARRTILASRLATTRALVTACQDARKLPAVWLNASAVGYYGTVAEQQCDESTPRGTGFLADVAAAWEAEAAPLAGMGVHLHAMRLGVVLARQGGMLPLLRRASASFVGGPLGSGAQWLSWIHLDDAAQMFLWALSGHQPAGPINAAAPNAVRQAVLMERLGQVLKKPSWLRAPAFPLRLALGQMADELLLGGQNVVPKAALSGGFGYAHPSLDGALRDLLG